MGGKARTLADLALQLHAGDAAAAATTCRHAAAWWERFAEGPYQHRAAAWRAAAQHLEQLANSVRHTTIAEGEESMKWDVEATQYVVIDDGAYVYPVLREDLGPDDSPDALAEMSPDEYQDWCERVPADERYAAIGTPEMAAFCRWLEAQGAPRWYIAPRGRR